VVAGAYAVTVRAQVAILATFNTQIKLMEEQVGAHFGRHPDVEVYLSQPGLGGVLGARVLAEFGDDKARYADARARKNYAGTSPITRQSGRKKIVLARYVHNDRLVDALGQQAFAALKASPGARAYYDQQRARGIGHRAALRQLGNRLVGILHGCLKTRGSEQHHRGLHRPDPASWRPANPAPAGPPTCPPAETAHHQSTVSDVSRSCVRYPWGGSISGRYPRLRRASSPLVAIVGSPDPTRNQPRDGPRGLAARRADRGDSTR
jgi:Transposase IS116/IS110/IS902 family